MSSLRGSLVTETFPFDGGRSATVYVPPDPPEAVVYAADGGWHTERLAKALEASAERLATVVVGVHGLDDDDGRLHEYVERFGRERFQAFERFFVEEVRTWVASKLGVEFAAERTAVWGPRWVASSRWPWECDTRRSTGQFSARRLVAASHRQKPACQARPHAPIWLAEHKSNGFSTTRSGGRTRSAKRAWMS